MYEELYQYFVLHKQLSLPGIGIFSLERKPADIDFANKLVNPPSFSIALHPGNSAPSRKLFAWLASVFQISEREAVMKFNDFVFDIKDQVMSGKKLHWQGIGSLSKGLAGEIKFESYLIDKTEGSSITAIKVIRENAEHTVRVGESEKTSVEMLELLHPGKLKRGYWWQVALAVVIAAFVFIAWYFSVYGPHPGSTGNVTKVTPSEVQVTYKLLP